MNRRNTLKLSTVVLAIFYLLLQIPVGHAAPSEKKAVVLAVFGTSHESALPGILNIQKQVQAVLPKDIPVRLAFTSNIIRRIWQERRMDEKYAKTHPEVPDQILHVKGPLATMADFQDEGYGYIIVQPTHISCGEEFTDLTAYVQGLNSIETVKKRNRPFNKVIVGRPALGMYGIEHEYQHDIEKVAATLAPDVEMAKKEGRALVYLAHGNEHYSTGAYLELEHVMRQRYPEVLIYITMVEGFPGFDILLDKIAADKTTKVMLKPLMTVAGDHAKNDMAGDEPGSLKNILQAKGLDVSVIMEGLGENDSFALIFAEHIKNALADEGLGF